MTGKINVISKVRRDKNIGRLTMKRDFITSKRTMMRLLQVIINPIGKLRKGAAIKLVM